MDNEHITVEQDESLFSEEKMNWSRIPALQVDNTNRCQGISLGEEYVLFFTQTGVETLFSVLQCAK